MNNRQTDKRTPVIPYCIMFVFRLALLCYCQFCVATEFSVNKDLFYIIFAHLRLWTTVLCE